MNDDESKRDVFVGVLVGRGLESLAHRLAALQSAAEFVGARSFGRLIFTLLLRGRGRVFSDWRG